MPLFIGAEEEKIFAGIMVIRFFEIYYFWNAYESLVNAIIPLRLWNIAFAATLWYQVNKMPDECLRYVTITILHEMLMFMSDFF